MIHDSDPTPINSLGSELGSRNGPNSERASHRRHRGLIVWITLRDVLRKCFVGCVALDALLILAVILRFQGRTEQVGVLGFLAFMLIVRTVTARWIDPFLTIFLVWSMMFVELPLARVGTFPESLKVDSGLAFQIMPPSGETVCLGLVQLALCYCGILLAIRCVTLGRQTWGESGTSWLARAFVVGSLMLGVNLLYDHAFVRHLSTFGSVAKAIVEVIKFCTFDGVVVIFLALALTACRAESSRRETIRSRLWWLVTLGMVAIHTFNGSKGALMLVFMGMLLFPLALGGMLGRSRILIPRTRLALCMAIAALPLFAIGSNIRRERSVAPELSVADVIERSTLAPIDLVNTFDIAADRVSIPLYRYLAIFDRFNCDTAANHVLATRYLDYTARSFANLLLPGTPFGEAYAPSSALLEPMLAHGSLKARGNNRDSYLVTLNSQPTTLFGMTFISAGWFSPWVVVLVTALLRLGARSTSSPVWFGSIFAFHALLSCYGCDAALQLSISAGVTFGLLGIMCSPRRKTSELRLWESGMGSIA